MNKLDSAEISHRDWLDDLLSLFPGGDIRAGDCRLISDPETMPQPARDLLVHHEHMTETLEKHHGHPVQLHVERVLRDCSIYARKLHLSAPADPAADSGPAVMTGIVRIWLDLLDAEVVHEILTEGRPLGRILIDHDVMREVESLAYLEVRMRDALKRLFGADPDVEITHGRLARIYLRRQPAIDVLEIVAPS